MQLDTQRLTLRPLEESDAQQMYDYAKNPSVGSAAGWKPHESVGETLDMMKTIFIGQPGVFGMILKETGRLIGTLGLIDDPKRQYAKARMLGYSMGEEWWGRGLMTEAARAVIEYGFSSMGLELISAYCYPANARSKRVLEKLGFKYEGTLSLCEQLYDGRVLPNDCYALTPASKPQLSLIPYDDGYRPYMQKWLFLPHVMQWYHEPEEWLRELDQRNGEFAFVKHFILLENKTPVGFAQYYPTAPAGEPCYTMYEGDGVYSIDYLVGEPDRLGQGLGKAAAGLITQKVAALPGASLIVVQPEPENLRSRAVLLANGYKHDAESDVFVLALR